MVIYSIFFLLVSLIGAVATFFLLRRKSFWSKTFISLILVLTSMTSYVTFISKVTDYQPFFLSPGTPHPEEVRKIVDNYYAQNNISQPFFEQVSVVNLDFRYLQDEMGNSEAQEDSQYTRCELAGELGYWGMYINTMDFFGRRVVVTGLSCESWIQQ